MKGLKIRLSRKLVIVLGGIVVLGGGSGAVALYIGPDKILGPSYEEVNGLKCTTAQLVKIKREQRSWVRKYVFTEGGDGPARLKTALRVAKSLQESEKADLIQVTVLDKAGPTQRSQMRGRAIGAQVVYIPDLARSPVPSETSFSAFYVDGKANSSGEFFGMRIDPPEEDMEKLAASLTDKADCVMPVTEPAADPHGSSGGKKGKKSSDHGGGGHGEAAGHDSASDKKADDGHGGGDKPAPAAGDHGGEPAAKAPDGESGSGGLLGSITSMIFGSGKKDAPAANEQPGETAAATDHAATDKPAAEPAEQPGLVARMKGMIFGGGEEKAVVAEPVARPVATEAAGETAKAPADGIDPMKVAAPATAAPVAQAPVQADPAHGPAAGPDDATPDTLPTPQPTAPARSASPKPARVVH